MARRPTRRARQFLRPTALLPSLLRKHLAKRFHLDALEYALQGVGIVLREGLRGVFTLEIRQDQAAAAVRERTCDDHLAGVGERAQIRQMGGSHGGTQPRAIGTVVTEDY